MENRCKKCGAVLNPNQLVCHICGLVQTDDRGLLNPKLIKKLMKQYQREVKLAKLAKYFMWLCVVVSVILIFGYPNNFITKIICVSLLILALVVSFLLSRGFKKWLDTKDNDFIYNDKW